VQYPYTIEIAPTLEGLKQQLRELAVKEPQLKWSSGDKLLIKSDPLLASYINKIYRYLEIYSPEKLSRTQFASSNHIPFNTVLEPDPQVQLYPNPLNF
jgi:hypothetical protein